MTIETSGFGKTRDGHPVSCFELSNGNRMVVTVIDYGATVTSIRIPDKQGKPIGVVLGYDTIEEYESGRACFGATVGRYGNRIARGTFVLHGQQIQLSCNEGDNHLHGGFRGFNSLMWNAEVSEDQVSLIHVNANGTEGFPGNLKMRVSYRLTEDNELSIEYEAQTDLATVLNPTHHSYFNLSGVAGATMLDHCLQIFADAFTPVEKDLIPTGEIVPIAGTPFDFRDPRRIGDGINAPHQQLRFGKGYDHNWVLGNGSNEFVKSAELSHAAAGLIMTVYTTEPGLQFYSGNHLPLPHRALCLETQHYPDSPNNPHFPTTVLEPGSTFRSRTSYRFETT